MYAQGMGETRSARNLLLQARLWSDPVAHLEVVIRMYQMRFSEELTEGLTLQQIRGREGVRAREAYARASRETGIPWRGRSYRSDDWQSSDPVNRALSSANSCLYGVCHAAIVSLGYSPGLGFVHTGKMLSFVWDVADLYKADITIPLAFQVVADGTTNLETRVRRACRDSFSQSRMLQRIAPDITYALTGRGRRPDGGDTDIDRDPALDVDLALPGGLWDPELGAVKGGVNQAGVSSAPAEEGEP